MRNLTIRLSSRGEQGVTLVPHSGLASGRSSSFKEPAPVDTSGHGGKMDSGTPAVARKVGNIEKVAGVDIVGRRSSRSNGRKVHFCVKCDFPIAIYGRLQPCHHAFCLECASGARKCPICKTSPSAIEEFDYHEGLFICGVPGCLVSFPSRHLLLNHVVDDHADLTKAKPAPLPDSAPPSDAKPRQSNTPPPQNSQNHNGPETQTQSRPQSGAQPPQPPPPLPHMQGYRPPLPPGPFSPGMRPRPGPPMDGGGAPHDGFQGAQQGPMGMNMGEFRPGMVMHMGPRGPMPYPGMYDGGPRRAPGPYGGGQPRPMDPAMEGYGWGMGGPNMGAGHAYLPQVGAVQNSVPGAGHGQWRPPAPMS